ncbi:hypothetical protein ACCO45_000181, partial [Purpureocillium lilacinum]
SGRSQCRREISDCYQVDDDVMRLRLRRGTQPRTLEQRKQSAALQEASQEYHLYQTVSRKRSSISMFNVRLRHINDSRQHAACGENPIRGFTVDYLGEQLANNSCSHRDLGFAGSIAGQWFAVYGDTLWAAPGVRHPADDVDGFHGMVRNSVSRLGPDPLVVHDLNLNERQRQNQFAQWKEEWGETNTTGFGGTSIVETDPQAGRSCLLPRPNAQLKNNNEDYTHAGIAKVRLENGTPVAERLGKGWWDTSENAKYGDIAAYRDVNSDYIYALGHPPKQFDGKFIESQYVYQARVKANQAFDLKKYEYWWGRQQGWKRDRLTSFTPETAVMWGVGQGQIVYSNYFQDIYVCPCHWCHGGHKDSTQA